MSLQNLRESSVLKSLVSDYYIKNIAVLSAANGVAVYESATERQRSKLAPIAGLPTAFSRRLYSKAVDLSLISTYLVDRMSCDSTFIDTHLSEMGRVDEFTAGLLRVFRSVYVNGPKRLSDCPRLHALRTDWMIDSAVNTGEAEDNIKQVEINSISCAFAGLSEKLTPVHRHLIADLIYKQWPHDIIPNKAAALEVAQQACPENIPATKVARAMAQAQTSWYKRCAPASLSSTHRPLMLYIVTSDEKNEVDQRVMHFAAEHEGLEVLRTTMGDIADAIAKKEVVLTPGDKGESLGQTMTLKVDGVDRVVSVIYWRAAYDPEHYLPANVDGVDSWAVREVLERSSAVLVPSVPTQLVGAKKIQQVLSSKKQLLELGLDDEAADLLLSSTALQFDPKSDDEETAAALDNAAAKPEAWVLKPQREGGGNNLHGAELAQQVLLEKKRKAEEGASFASPYILMQKIRSATRPTLFLYPLAGENVQEAIGELGIYTTLVVEGPEDKIAVRAGESCGHVLRSKYAESQEGGVAKGYAVLDTPLLMDGF